MQHQVQILIPQINDTQNQKTKQNEKFNTVPLKEKHSELLLSELSLELRQRGWLWPPELESSHSPGSQPICGLTDAQTKIHMWLLQLLTAGVVSPSPPTGISVWGWLECVPTHPENRFYGLERELWDQMI